MFVKEINKINKDIITQEKMKKKLLEHNSNGNITDKDFVNMTADCNEEIERLHQKLDMLTATAKTEQEMKKELANIKSILKAAEKHIDNEEIDKAFVDRYIKEIMVYPEDDVTKFEIRLNAGTTVEKFLENTRGRTGHISKKMIKAYEESMK